MGKIIISGIRWIIGVFIILPAFVGLFDGELVLAILLLIIGLLFIPPIGNAVFRKKKKNATSTFESKPIIKSRTDPETIINQDQVTARKSTVKVTYQQLTQPDDSIIDVTGESYQLKSDRQNEKSNQGKLNVPYWRHQYVYNYSEINGASSEQKKFYQYYKSSFYKGEFIDLEGNTNYAFILLFDLLNEEFINHKDFERLEKELKVLGQHYPKTQSYANSFLIQKLETAGDKISASRLRAEQYHYSQNSYYGNEYSDWRLGSKFKTKLNLGDKDVELLNKLWSPSNNFCSIEYCCIEVIKLYLNTIKAFDSTCLEVGSSLISEFNFVSDLIAKKHFKYRANSNNYKYSLETTNTELYSLIFKICENAVRELYDHKRKVTAEIPYNTNPEILKSVEERVVSRINQIISEQIIMVAKPDEATEIELNAKNTSRWKNKFEELTLNLEPSNGANFQDAIIKLGSLNKSNPSVENIYFEASKFIAKTDREIALNLYLHYLYYDLQSVTFNNKQLTKTIQKSLFKSDEQLLEFERIVNDLVSNKDLESAVKAIPSVFAPKRKKIQLNTEAIKEAHQKHAGTVELLNEYLQDEPEEEPAIYLAKENHQGEVRLEIKPSSLSQEVATVNPLGMNDNQVEILEMFLRGGYCIPQVEIEAFAKSKGLFKNQLIESINDSCYETIDDLLIEEEDEEYTINETYYQRIFAV